MSRDGGTGGPDRVFRSRRVVTGGAVRAACVHVRGGVIEAVTAYEDAGGEALAHARGGVLAHARGAEVVDLGDAVLLPGLVDTHVHVNEPGRTEWEGFESATRAAAAGGVTTLVDMPLNSVPATTTVVGLEAKRRAAEGRCRVDVGFWGGLVPENERELEPLAGAGVLGFKCFLVHSGVAEFGHVGERELRQALPVLCRLGVPLLVHAEMPGPIEAAAAGEPADSARPTALPSADPRRYATYLASRPAAAETEAVALLARLCRETGARIHVVHVSAAGVLPLLRRATAEGLPLGGETCPHYLCFAAEEVPDGATELKCAPPIRDAANRERLWAGLADGALGMVVSDHSSCPPELKLQGTGDFLRAWGGIASLQVGLAAVWTGARERGHGPAELADWMAASPARLAGLDGRKGAIEPGRDADLVAWRPDESWRVDPAALFHRHPLTPYAGRVLAGRVEATYLRGETIYEHGRHVGPARGRLLVREGAAWSSRS